MPAQHSVEPFRHPPEDELIIGQEGVRAKVMKDLDATSSHFWTNPKLVCNFLGDTKSYESTLNLCFKIPATLIFTKFVPNKLKNHLQYATVALSK
jgi:hypothetical protein